MWKTLFRLMLLLPLVWPGTLWADLVLVAHSDAEVDKISREDAINIYMGRLRRFPSGPVAQPLDLLPASPEKALFYHRLVNKELADIDAYWARLVFSGRTSPPPALANQEAVLERVARDRNAIGYLDRTRVDGRVKIILELEH